MALKTEREQISIVLNCEVCVNLVPQPQEINIIPISYFCTPVMGSSMPQGKEAGDFLVV